MRPIYLDFNASTPLLPEVASAMQPYLTEFFGNPSSSHWHGEQTKKAITLARQQVAGLLGCDLDEIIFTSGGTEANNFAIRGVCHEYSNKGKHVITSSIEHPAVLEVLRQLEKEGFKVTYLPVDEDGLISLDEVRDNITNETILITIMHANNEVGTIQPIEGLAKLARKNGIILHTDAAQSVGKIPVKVNDLEVDLLSLAGHKFYAPKGVGALYLRRGVKISKLLHGADHENKMRAGTENVLEIVGLGKAAEIMEKNTSKNQAHLKSMRDRLEEGIIRACPFAKINGHPEKRLPNTLNISFPNLEANTLLSEIGDQVAASAGAACHSDSITVSYVLTAMGIPVDIAMGTIRFSTGVLTSVKEVDQATKAVTSAVLRLQPSHTENKLSLPAEEIKLTKYTHGLGCACKIRPQDLEKIVHNLPRPKDKNILVDTATSDDAAVYKLSDDLAVVQTLDFFTPIVDDPYQFGAIAAVNSLSDIYAMGARPIFALNIVAFPSKRLPLEVLGRILAGASDKVNEAGIYIVGGHSIEDNEPKFGLSVTGLVHPNKILQNSTARPGDVLILTKPIGTGIASTAMKRGIADKVLIDAAISVMAELNKTAAEIMEKYDVHACTDITGFGLIGHLKEMTQGSRVNAEIYQKEVPLIPGIRPLAQGDVVPGGTVNNHKFCEKVVNWPADLARVDQLILCDAQTSGGLLIAVSEKDAVDLISDLKKKLPEASIIGRFTSPGQGIIEVVGDGHL